MGATAGEYKPDSVLCVVGGYTSQPLARLQQSN